MTKEEAIRIISGYEVYGCGYCLQGCDEVEEALRLAIDALRQETVIRCKDCIYARMTVNGDSAKYCLAWQDSLMDSLYLPADFYCGFAERKEE